MLIYGFLGFIAIVTAAFVRKIPDKYEDTCIGAAVPLFLLLLLPLELLTGWIRPMTMDLAFRHADLALGLDGLAFTRWLARIHLYPAIPPIYSALPLAMALCWALERSRTFLRAAVIGPLLAFPLYLLFPASGPEYAFPNFPLSDAQSIPISWAHARNCFPSMHLTWAMLVAMNLQNPRWRWLFVLYAVLMAFAAVAGGEHYFVDVIAAVPFAFVVQRAAIAFPNFAAVRDELSRWMPSTKPSGQNVVAQQMSEEAEISSCTAESES